MKIRNSYEKARKKNDMIQKKEETEEIERR